MPCKWPMIIKMAGIFLLGAVDNWKFREDHDDNYTQPGKLFRLMRKAQKQALFENTARAIGDASKFIKIRCIGYCLKADLTYGKVVADTLGILLERVYQDKG